jgi:hypothetical protein
MNFGAILFGSLETNNVVVLGFQMYFEFRFESFFILKLIQMVIRVVFRIVLS